MLFSLYTFKEEYRQPCSLQCYNNTCERFTGRCLLGCRDGFYGEMCDRGNDYPGLLILFLLQVIFIFKRFEFYSIIFCIDPFNTNTLILLLITYLGLQF